MTTKECAIRIAEAVNASRDGVPSGHMYAALMTVGVSLETYERALAALVRIKLVKVSGMHYVTWVGPEAIK